MARRLLMAGGALAVTIFGAPGFGSGFQAEREPVAGSWLAAALSETLGVGAASAQSLEQYENRRLRRQSQGDIDAQDASRRYDADRRGDAIAPRIERQQDLRLRQADRVLPPVGLRGRSTY